MDTSPGEAESRKRPRDPEDETGDETVAKRQATEQVLRFWPHAPLSNG